MLKSKLKLTQQVIDLTKSVRSLSVSYGLDRQGYKKYKFNPAYYPQARGRHPVSWKITKANKYQPLSPGNNAHNIPLFSNWGSFRYSSIRVNDPIHGEKYMYPHEISYQNRLSGMSVRQYREGEAHPKNPKITNYFKTEERIDWEEKNLHWKPLPRELNYSPFQCPQLAMIEKIFGQWGSFLPGNKRNRGERNMFTKVGNEIRYRQVMKLKNKRKEIEKLENEKDAIVSKMAELQNLPTTSTYEDLDKLEIDIADDEKYQTLLSRVEDAKIEEEMIELNPHPIIMEGIDRVKPTVDFRIIERTQTSRDAIPIPIEDSKAIQYAIQWLVEATHVADPSRRFCTQGKFGGRDLQMMAHRLADEIYNSLEGKGYAFNKKLAHHKIAESQRQYAGTYWADLRVPLPTNTTR